MSFNTVKIVLNIYICKVSGDTRTEELQPLMPDIKKITLIWMCAIGWALSAVQHYASTPMELAAAPQNDFTWVGDASMDKIATIEKLNKIKSHKRSLMNNNSLCMANFEIHVLRLLVGEKQMSEVYE